MSNDPEPEKEDYKHRNAMERHTRPSLWGPGSWWRAGLLVLAGMVVLIMLLR